MQIRLMRESDLPQVAKLYLQAYEADWSEAGAQRYVAKFFRFEPESCLVAEADGELAGAALAFSYERESGLIVFLQELFVLPGRRKQGVGRELVKFLREGFQNPKINVTPLVKADTNVLNFYNSLGFEQDKAVTFFVD